MIHWTTPVPFCNLFPLLEFSSPGDCVGKFLLESLSSSPSLSLYAAETEKPEKPRRRDETTEREREVSRPRKESVDMARGGEGRRGHATR